MITGNGSAGREVLKLTSRIIRRKVAERIPAREAIDSLKELAPGNGGVPLAGRLRSVPIQRSIDIAVPLEVAYEEWLRLEFLPEGAHRVQNIKRQADTLKGSIVGARAQHSTWRAEIREERPNESFAWRSTTGSDCLGLVTFHRLGERLTRLEVELDVVPSGVEEAFELLAHIADRRTELDLRRFKAELERISPDDYPVLSEHGPDDVQPENEEE